MSFVLQDGNGEHIIIIAVVSVLVIIALLTIIGYIVYKKRFKNYNVAKTATTAKTEKEQSSDLQVSYHPVKSKDENDEMEPLWLVFSLIFKTDLLKFWKCYTVVNTNAMQLIIYEETFIDRKSQSNKNVKDDRLYINYNGKWSGDVCLLCW